MPEIRVLDESRNPSGTIKDRKSAHAVAKAQAAGVRHLCIITAGNGGYSLALAARPAGMRVTCIVRPSLKPSIREKLEGACDRVVEFDYDARLLGREEAIALARVGDEEVWNVTDGFSEAYAGIIDDVGADLDYLLCPISTGEAFIGCYRAIKERGLPTTLVGVRPIAHDSFADKLSGRWNPNDEELARIVADGHVILRLTEEEIVAAHEEYKDRYVAEPSATAVWAGYKKMNLLPDARVGIVSSGKGLQ